MEDNNNNGGYNPTPPPPTPHRFVNKINALTPLIQLAIATVCVVLAAQKPELWESQGFNIFLGSLGGSAATGTLTQKDDYHYYDDRHRY